MVAANAADAADAAASARREASPGRVSVESIAVGGSGDGGGSSWTCSGGGDDDDDDGGGGGGGGGCGGCSGCGVAFSEMRSGEGENRDACERRGSLGTAASLRRSSRESTLRTLRRSVQRVRRSSCSCTESRRLRLSARTAPSLPSPACRPACLPACLLPACLPACRPVYRGRLACLHSTGRLLDGGSPSGEAIEGGPLCPRPQAIISSA